MDKEFEKRIDEVNEEMLSDASPELAEAPSQVQPTDYYQMSQNAQYEASQKPTAYGSPAQVAIVVDDMVDEFKQTNYNVNKNQYDHLLDAEAKDSAEYLRQNYMTNDFLPMVESLVEVYGVDALLNNNKALAKLDSVAITPNDSGDGFTAGYLKQMHNQQIGTQESISDMEVTRGLQRITAMANSDDIRGSVSQAKKLKQRVDDGELSASEKDYNLLLQVSSYK